MDLKSLRWYGVLASITTAYLVTMAGVRSAKQHVVIFCLLLHHLCSGQRLSPAFTEPDIFHSAHSCLLSLRTSRPHHFLGQWVFHTVCIRHLADPPGAEMRGSRVLIVFRGTKESVR